MKKLIIILILICGCEKPDEPVDNEHPCPLPERFKGYGWGETPPMPHTQSSVSYDLKKLAFILGEAFALEVLDLETGNIKVIDVQSMLPVNVLLLGVSSPYWCPYDNERILIHASTNTDTIGDGKKFVYGHNIYIVSIDGSNLQRVTPAILGPAGPKELKLFGGWLPGSTFDKDLIQLGYTYRGLPYHNIYIPQNNELQDVIHQYPTAVSMDGSKYFNSDWADNNVDFIFNINNIQLNFPEPIYNEMLQGSFSPDGKYLAILINPLSNIYDLDSNIDSARLMEIWIIDVDKFLNEKPDTVKIFKIINLRFAFCMFASYTGSNIEFISNSTLAVSMHDAEADFSYLWEITIDGKIVRQLTFEP